MFKAKGRFIGTVSETKKGGFLRKFITDSDALLTVWAKDASKLQHEGEYTLSFEVQELVFAK